MRYLILLAVLLIATPAQAFIENTAVRTLATDGWWQGDTNVGQASVDACGDKYFTAYGTNTGGVVKAISYDYVTGVTSSATTVSTITNNFSAAHDLPSIYCTPDGVLEVYYGGIRSQQLSADTGPWFNKSSSQFSIAAWGARDTVPYPGSLSEMGGGYDLSGRLHLGGQAQTGRAGTAIRGIDFGYARRASENGAWENITQPLVTDTTSSGNPPAGSQGDPGCGAFMGTSRLSNTTHILWTRALNGCAGSYSDLYYARSTNGGATWCNAAGSTCFSPPLQGTLGAGSIWVYPAAYQVYSGSVQTGFAASQLSNGTPVVTFRTSAGLLFRKYSGSWISSTIDAASGGHCGVSLVVTGADEILVYAPTLSGTTCTDLKQWSSTNAGASFSGSTVQAKGAATNQKFPFAKFFHNLGGHDRVILRWHQNGSVNSSTATKVMVVDIPVTEPANPDVTAPTAPGTCTATATSTTSIDLQCDASTDDTAVTEYRDEMCTGSGCSDFVQIRASAPLIYTKSGLTANTLYRFRRRAADAVPNVGSYSSTFETTTPAGVDTTAPTAPSALVASRTQSLVLLDDGRLTWTASSDAIGVTEYRVERGDSNCANFVQIGAIIIAETPGPPTEYRDPNIAFTDGPRCYRVKALDAAGNASGYSGTAIISAPSSGRYR